MTINLFRFPLLVVFNIMQQMDLIDILALGLCSKKSRLMVHNCLSPEKFKLEFRIGTMFTHLKRCYSNGDTKEWLFVTFSLGGMMQGRPRPGQQCWKLSDQANLYVTEYGREDNTSFYKVHWNSTKLIAGHAMFQYFVTLFPKLNLQLRIFTLDLEVIRMFMTLHKTVALETVGICRPAGTMCDDLVRYVLNECREVRNLHIPCEISTNFEYEIRSPPFKCKYLCVKHAEWVTMDHIINLFLTCTSVKLENKSFDDDDLKAIFEKWVEDSPIENLHILSGDGSYQGKTLTNLIGHLPRVRVVRKAKIPVHDSALKVAGFREGRCYLIQQKSGKKALVYQLDRLVHLTTKYEIDDRIDRIAVEFEENEEGGWIQVNEQ